MNRCFNGWRVQTGMPETFAECCCAEPKDTADGFERVTRSHSRTLVCRFLYEGCGYYYKEYFFPGFYKLAKDLFRGSWSRRATRVHAQLEAAGFKVARVVAIGRKGWRRFVVTEEVGANETIRHVFRRLEEPGREELMRQYGNMVGQMHKSGFSHGDLRWGNILVSGSAQRYAFVLIDNERTKKHSFGVPERLCIKNLVHTRYSGLAEEMSDSVWDCFFDAYCAAFSRASRSRACWGKKLAHKLKQRIARGKRKAERISA